ncbi:uncharacterized protein [Nicotiana tomentosiformis]|uniref:uncharacterized protein n=1 Tax=Nicotiana tomentosiformis TaxID=4098 RepID=UPI00388CD0D9
MSVTQYEMRFSELARHAVWLVPTKRESIRRFIDSLYYYYRFVMTQESVLGATFDEVVDIARRLEMVRSQEHEEREAKRPRGSGDFSDVPSGGQSYHNMGRPYRPAQMSRPVHCGVSSSHGSFSARPGQSSLSALPAQSSSRAPSVQGFSKLCSKLRKVQSKYIASRNKARTGQGATVIPGVAVGSIFDDAGEHPRCEDIPPITTPPESTIPAQTAPIPTPTEGVTVPPSDIPVPPPAPASGPAIFDKDLREAIQMLAQIVASQAQRSNVAPTSSS